MKVTKEADSQEVERLDTCWRNISFTLSTCPAGNEHTQSRRRSSRMARGSAQEHGQCADHNSWTPDSAPPAYHEGLMVAKAPSFCSWGAGRECPFPGRPQCCRTWSPRARHLGGSRRGSPRTMRGGERSICEGTVVGKVSSGRGWALEPRPGPGGAERLGRRRQGRDCRDGHS